MSDLEYLVTNKAVMCLLINKYRQHVTIRIIFIINVFNKIPTTARQLIYIHEVRGRSCLFASQIFRVEEGMSQKLSTLTAEAKSSREFRASYRSTETAAHRNSNTGNQAKHGALTQTLESCRADVSRMGTLSATTSRRSRRAWPGVFFG
jgi:hypothetical protein